MKVTYLDNVEKHKNGTIAKKLKALGLKITATTNNDKEISTINKIHCYMVTFLTNENIYIDFFINKTTGVIEGVRIAEVVVYNNDEHEDNSGLARIGIVIRNKYQNILKRMQKIDEKIKIDKELLKNKAKETKAQAQLKEQIQALKKGGIYMIINQNEEFYSGVGFTKDKKRIKLFKTKDEAKMSISNKKGEAYKNLSIILLSKQG